MFTHCLLPGPGSALTLPGPGSALTHCPLPDPGSALVSIRKVGFLSTAALVVF